MVVSPEQYGHVVELVKASQAIHNKELHAGGRTDTLRPILSHLLGSYIATGEEPGTKADGHIGTENGARLMIISIKNKVGSGGSDPSVQGAIAYAEYWSEVRPTFVL
jgi:hypothetical protein